MQYIQILLLSYLYIYIYIYISLTFTGVMIVLLGFDLTVILNGLLDTPTMPHSGHIILFSRRLYTNLAAGWHSHMCLNLACEHIMYTL